MTDEDRGPRPDPESGGAPPHQPADRGGLQPASDLEHSPRPETQDDAVGGMRQLVEARKAKLERLRAAGIDPYPARNERTHTAAQAAAAFEAVEASGDSAGPHDVVVVGRLIGAVRRLGGSAFVHVMDGSGSLQLHLRRDSMGGAAFEQFLADFDPGDFVAARGWMFRTRRGEVSLAVERVAMLAKSLLPLPEKWHGLQDLETRLRQRYLDLVSNEETRDRFRVRSAVISGLRAFLDSRGFVEVETPVLQPIYGGGAAEPFTTHYRALEQTMYLRIADELYLKRLLVGGYERVYEIAKDFRNEGIDRTHMPEFTQMECYWAFSDYTAMMALTEEMIASLARDVLGTTRLEYDGHELDLEPPWQRLTVREAIARHTGLDIEDHTDLDGLRTAMESAGIDADPQPTWARTVDELLTEHVERHLRQPTLLLDYPVELSPLAKRSPVDPRYVERFEPFAGGMELGNAFTELNDPLEQRDRFAAMAAARCAGDVEAHPLDEDFLTAVMHGMPPASGLGIGVDRLVMLLTGQTNIREVVLFPQLRT